MAVLKSTLKLSLLDHVSANARRITGTLDALQRRTTIFNSTLSRVAAFGAGYIGVTQGLERTYTAAADAQSALTEIGIKAGLSHDQLAVMQRRLTQLSPTVNQFSADLTAGVDTMLTMGLSADQAMGSIGAIGKAATATGATITDLSSASVSAMQNLGVMPTEVQKMLDGMAAAGNAGAFELKDMSQYFPQLTASAKTLGLQGVGGVNDMAAALQIARRGAGDASTAANNLSDFMGKIVTPQTIKNFKKFGVDVTKELATANKKGISPIEHFIRLLDKKTKGGKGELLTQIFGDKQTLDFIRPMIAGFDDYLRIRDEANKANGTIADAYLRRMEDANEKTKAFWISIDNVGKSIGARLLKPVGDAATYLADVFNTLERRVTVFDRLGAMTSGFLNGLGGEGTDLNAATQSWRDFIFGVKDSATAADEMGQTFARFQKFGADLRALNDAVQSSPIAKFLSELGLAMGGMGLSRWFRLFAIAAGIKAIIDAARDASSVKEFVDNLKGLSAIEWAGVGAGLLMIAGRAKAAVGWFKQLKSVTPSGTTAGGATPSATATSAYPTGAFNLKNLFGGVLKGGAQALLGYLGEAGIRKGFQGVYGDKYVEPPDLATSLDNFIAAWRDAFASMRNVTDPTMNLPYRQQAIDNAVGARNAGIGGSTTDTLPGKTLDDLGVRQPIKLDMESISALSTPRGVQDVNVKNLVRPNVEVNVSMSNSFAAGDAAAAARMGEQVGAKVKAAVESSLGGGGGF